MPTPNGTWWVNKGEMTLLDTGQFKQGLGGSSRVELYMESEMGFLLALKSKREAVEVNQRDRD